MTHNVYTRGSLPSLMELQYSYSTAVFQVDWILQSSKCFILEFMFQISVYQTDPPTEVIAVGSGKGRHVIVLEFWGLKSSDISQHFWGSCWFHLQVVYSVSEARAESSSRMLVTIYQSTRRHFPEDRSFIMHPPSQKKKSLIFIIPKDSFPYWQKKTVFSNF
jgi:hypothetical protein